MSANAGSEQGRLPGLGNENSTPCPILTLWPGRGEHAPMASQARRSNVLLWGALILVLVVGSLGLFLYLGPGRESGTAPGADGLADIARPPADEPPRSGVGGVADDPSWNPDTRRRGSCRPVGTVTWEDGSPAPGAIIEILHDPASEHGSYLSWNDSGVRTDEAGTFELPRQSRCPLRLAATVPGKGYGIEEELPAFDGRGVDPYPDPYRRDIVVRPAGAVEGTVVDPEGAGIGGATVYLSTWRILEFVSGRVSDDESEGGWDNPEIWNEAYSSWSRSVQTDTDGRFTFDALTADRWVFRAEADGYSPDQVEQEHGSDGVASQIVIELHPVVPRTVRVIDEGGRPIPGATVWVLRQSIDSVDRSADDTMAVAELVTGPDGTVTFEEVDTLGRTVVATAPGFDERSIQPTDRRQLSHVIRLGSGGCVSGTLDDSLRGTATCHFMNWSRNPGDQEGLVVPLHFPSTDDTGRFTWCGIPSGIAQLSLVCTDPTNPELPSGEVWTGAVEVRPGESTEIGTLRRP